MDERSNLPKKKRHGPGRRKRTEHQIPAGVIIENVQEVLAGAEGVILHGWHSRNPEARDPVDQHRGEVVSREGELLQQFYIETMSRFPKWPTWKQLQTLRTRMDNPASDPQNSLPRMDAWVEKWMEEQAQDNG